MYMKRIERIEESPCSKCGYSTECDVKISKNYSLSTIKDFVFPNKEMDYHDCGIYISLTAPELIDES